MLPYEKRRICDCAVQSRIGLDATVALFRLVGLSGLAHIFACVAMAKLRGEPWKGMPPPTSEKEYLSRIEIGDAILLYRALLRRMSQDRALAILRKIVAIGAEHSFSYLIEPIAPEALAKLPKEERHAMLERNLDRFPNADILIDEAGTECIAFRVLHCRFPGMALAAGHPELAPIFCSADKDFFEDHLGLAFARPHTIADGAPSCPFRLCRRPHAR